MTINKLLLTVLAVILMMVVHGEAKGGTKEIALNVDDVVADPSAYQGTITVKGVVMSTEAKQKLFGLIDMREYERCKVLTCSTKYLVVQFSGKLPKVEKKVMVTGQLKQVEIDTPRGKMKGYRFFAKAVKVVR